MSSGNDKLFADGSKLAVQSNPFGARSRIEGWKREARDAEAWRPMRSVLTAETDEEVQRLVDVAVERARGELQSQVDEKVRELSRGVRALEEAREQTLRETETDLVQLALHIAGQVLGVSIEERREFTTRMTEHALGLLREADKVVLRVSPEYAHELRVHLAERESGATTVELIEDSQIEDAGVVAECDLGRVDATLSRRLEEAAKMLAGGDS